MTIVCAREELMALNGGSIQGIVHFFLVESAFSQIEI